MDTPICDFVAQYTQGNPLRLHMPGHKGASLLGCEARDITEISGADVLYHPQGIIRQSENNAASLFGSGRTLYSTEGSSLPIRAMLYLLSLFAAQQGRKCVVAAGRNAHKVFVTAAALLNLEVRWIFPQTGNEFISCQITPAALSGFLDRQPEKPTAVYITSPDYLGNMTDIRALAEVCHSRGILLLVDNAHGAYLNFLPESHHPMALGADLCCDSAHKTLPVLTGGAYLHISKSAPSLFYEAADRAMALFASTSPSYLIMQSLDLANRYLADHYRERLLAAGERWHNVKKQLRQAGFLLAGSEPMKLTILPKPYGYTGDQVAELLEAQNIFCEFSDPDHLVMMLSPEFGEDTVQHICNALLSIPPQPPILVFPPRLPQPEQAVSIHDALFLACEDIPTERSLGRIMASPTVSCPPAIPIVSCGERISAEAIQAMVYYQIKSVCVLTEESEVSTKTSFYA